MALPCCQVLPVLIKMEAMHTQDLHEQVCPPPTKQYISSSASSAHAVLGESGDCMGMTTDTMAGLVTLRSAQGCATHTQLNTEATISPHTVHNNPLQAHSIRIS